MRKLELWLWTGALLLGLPQELEAKESILPAETVALSTNVDWVALAHANLALRTGETVTFALPSAKDFKLSRIRRALWLAALHGITRQTFADERTKELLSNELSIATRWARKPFATEIAICNLPRMTELITALYGVQTFPILVGEKEERKEKTIMTFTDKGIVGERSGLTYDSMGLAVSFIHSYHADEGMVFESDGSSAHNIFFRQFQDGSAVFVNLTSAPRTGLTFRRQLSRARFDLPKDGLFILEKMKDGPPQSRNMREKFISSLWSISFDLNGKIRIVTAEKLLDAVSETYIGKIHYKTTVSVPRGADSLVLCVDTDNAPVEALMDGLTLGVRAWEPYEWSVPSNCIGQEVKLEIIVDKFTLNGYLQDIPTWRRK